MKQLRLRAIMLGIWFVFVFNIERMLRAFAQGGILLNSEINLIQSYTYIFVALVFIVVLALPKIKPGVFIGFMSGSVSLFLVLWYNLDQWDKYEITDGSQIATLTILAIVQVSAIILTGLLTRQINASLQEFEHLLASIVFNHIGARPQPFYEGQGDMYRELKRARYYQRPLSVIAIETNQTDIAINIPALAQDVQQAMIKEFVLAKMARVLDTNLYEFNSLALKDHNFVITLPETDAETLQKIVARLKQTLAEEMNISPKIGAASFPEEAVTFERLVEIAIAKIQPDEAVADLGLTDATLLETQTSAVNESQLITEKM